jgi:hypothetical protein
MGVEGVCGHLWSLGFRRAAASSSKAAAVFDILAKGCWLFGLGSRLFALDGATPLAFAGVLALASLVAGLTAALAFTGVLTLAGMGFALLRHCLQGDSSWSRLAGCICADGHRSSHEAGDGCTRDECFCRIHLVLLVFCFEILNL